MPQDNPAGDPQVPAPPATTIAGDPQTPPATGDPAPQTVDIAALKRQIDELTTQLSAKTAELGETKEESIARRQQLNKLKGMQEQYDDLASRYAELEAERDALKAKAAELEQELTPVRQTQKTERESLLASMSEAHKAAFGDLSIEKLREIHSALYTPQTSPQPSQHADPPPATTGDGSLSLEAAIATGDKTKINAAMDRALADKAPKR